MANWIDTLKAVDGLLSKAGTPLTREQIHKALATTSKQDIQIALSNMERIGAVSVNGGTYTRNT